MTRLIVFLALISCSSFPDHGEDVPMVEEPVKQPVEEPSDTLHGKEAQAESEARGAHLVLAQKFELPDGLQESSGLALLPDGLLVSHNDSGNDSELYVIDSEGNKVRKVKVEDRNNDWEDICADTEGNIFISDLGNNSGTRKNLCIIKVKKGFQDEKKVNGNKIEIEFPYKEDRGGKKKANFDSEAIFWYQDRVYIITKSRCQPYEGIARIFSVPDEPGTYEAREECSFSTCNKGWMPCSVTSADMDTKSGRLVALTTDKVYLLSVGMEGDRLALDLMESYNIQGKKQREAVCWRNDSSLWITDEKHKLLGGGYLYRYDIKKK